MTNVQANDVGYVITCLETFGDMPNPQDILKHHFWKIICHCQVKRYLG